MKTKNKYFLGLTLLSSGLFLFDCFSIIFCVLKMNSVPEDKRVENAMGFVYLFLHLIILAVVLYYALKSYLQKDQILSVFMTLENGKKNHKAYRNCMVFSIIFLIFGLWFFLNSFEILHVMKFFSLGLNAALCNVGFSIGGVALYMYFYKVKPLGESLD